MADQAGAGDPGPDLLTITAGGLTVRMRPVGYIDYMAIPREFDAALAMPTDTPEQIAAFADAIVAFGRRVDAYAVGDARPSMIPPEDLMGFLRRWREGVRDAVVDPPSGAASPKRSSTSRRRAAP